MVFHIISLCLCLTLPAESIYGGTTNSTYHHGDHMHMTTTNLHVRTECMQYNCNADCIMSLWKHGWQRVAVHITCTYAYLTQIYMLQLVANRFHDHACDVESVV